MNKQQLLDKHAELMRAAEELRKQIDKIDSGELWVPGESATYYKVADTGRIYPETYVPDNPGDRLRLQQFNYFRTEREAEDHADKLRAFNELNMLANHLNTDSAGWTWHPDWSDESQSKYFIYYRHSSQKFYIDFNLTISRDDVVFKSEEAAKQALEMMSDHCRSYIKGEL